MFGIDAIGMNVRQAPTFVIDRPEGSGDYLIVFYKAKAVCEIEGREFPIQPDSCIIYQQGQPQKYRAVGGGYADHYLHFGLYGDEDRSYDLQRLAAIPFQYPIVLPDIGEAEQILRMLSKENVSASPNRSLYIDQLIYMLLLKLSEAADHPVFLSDSDRHIRNLENLRGELYSSAGRFHSVADMAEYTSLSVSYLQLLYRNHFGISCYEDLLSARMLTAQYYLSKTDFSIREIAGLCGYDSDISFLRSFRKRIGCTPGEFRRKGR